MRIDPVKTKDGKRPSWFSHLFALRFFSDELTETKISPHAVVDPKAEIADDVEVGPFCVIGPHVKIASGCRLLNRVTILGRTTIGKDNIIFPNCVLGAAPQDKKFRGEDTRLEIGDNNAFREAVTVHVGTEMGGGLTKVGDNNLLMVNAHLGHDVVVGNSCVLANNVMIAGHVHIHDYVAMMGGAGVHHFVTIGEHAYIGGYARIHHDVPPFVKVDGSDDVRGLNKVGLRRAGYSEADVEALDRAYRNLFGRRKPFSVALKEYDALLAGTGNGNGNAAAEEINPQVRRMVEFLQRRNQGRHGRYLESQRHKFAAAAAATTEDTAKATAANAAAEGAEGAKSPQQG
jgi:UDP-N-acetylglucosamine acyltransferase